MKRVKANAEDSKERSTMIKMINNTKSDVKSKMQLTDEDLKNKKKMLNNFVPQEVMIDHFGGENGQSLLWAMYADDVMYSYFKKEGRRIRYKAGARDGEDFIQDVMIGVRTIIEVEEKEVDGELVEVQTERSEAKNGIIAISDPNSSKVYEPTRKGERRTVCPHCNVSFWQASAGNSNDKYKPAGDKDIDEWRDDPKDAPDFLKNVYGKYNFCGGRHEIIPIEPGIDPSLIVQTVQQVYGEKITYEMLANQGRIRNVDGQLYVVDDRLSDIEETLNGEDGRGGRGYSGISPIQSNFSAEWIFEEDGHTYRQCRHPVRLVSPNSYIQDIIKYYEPTVIERGRQCDVNFYRCPVCEVGEFRDDEKITTGKNAVTEVKCNTCGTFFDINDENVVVSKHKLLMHQNLSLQQMVGKEGDAELGANIPDIKQEEPSERIESQMSVEQMLDQIEEVASTLNIKGADKARAIYEDMYLKDLSDREIMEKYFKEDYILHFTECLDCGHVEYEIPNPNSDQMNWYNNGKPIEMIRCPERDDHSLVENVIFDISEEEVETPQETIEEEKDIGEHTAAFKKVKKPETEKRDIPGLNLVEKEKEQIEGVTDEYEIKKRLGTNLVYHGAGKDVRSVSWLVDVIDPTKTQLGDSVILKDSDPRAYQGTATITPHIYQPINRLKKEIKERLAASEKLQTRYSSYIDYVKKDVDRRVALSPNKVSIKRLKVKINKVYAQMKARERRY